MAFYKTITKYTSPNRTPQSQVPYVFGMPRSIDYITIHWWGDPANKPTFEGVVAWLCNPRSEVSAHEVSTATGKRSATLVNYRDAAWHTGSARGNAKSLGIECDPRERAQDYEVVAHVIADIWRFYGRKIPLRRHSSWTPTACPGKYDLNRLNKMASNFLSPKPAPKPKPKPQPKPEPAKPEWIKNLQPYTKDDTGYNKPVKLTVLKASGIKRINLNTGGLLNNEVIPKGTVIDIVAKTKVKGKTYLISSYSKKKGMASGLTSDKNALGVPEKPPVAEKPEWLDNLVDIKDKDMWTRSEAPMLQLSNGEVVEMVPMGEKVKITHATEMVGKDLLVVEGGKYAFETLYLNDEPIKDKYEDLERRVSELERLINSLFESFKSFLNIK